MSIPVEKIAAKNPVRKPKKNAFCIGIGGWTLFIFSSKISENQAATGTTRQHPMLFTPGIVFNTAAPKPQTRGGKYLCEFIDPCYFFFNKIFSIEDKIKLTTTNPKRNPVLNAVIFEYR